MLKSKLILVLLASAVGMGACKKDEKKAEEAAKPTDSVATEAKPATEKKVESAEIETPPAAPTDTAAAAPAPAEEGKAEPVPDLTREQVAEKAVSMFSSMNEKVKAANGDCAKMASDFTAIIKEYKPVMESAKKFEEDPANKQWFEDNYGEKTKAIMGEMLGGIGECMNDPALKEAFAAMD